MPDLVDLIVTIDHCNTRWNSKQNNNWIIWITVLTE